MDDIDDLQLTLTKTERKKIMDPKTSGLPPKAVITHCASMDLIYINYYPPFTRGRLTADRKKTDK